MPLLTAAACAVCLIVFVGLTARGDSASWDGLARWGYLTGPAVWQGGYWALLTSVFVHIAAWHLAFNVYWLWHLGGAVERVLGRARWLAFFVAAAVLSSADQLAASGTTGHGASGVAYALFGFIWMGRREVPAFARILQRNVAALFWVWLVGCIIATRAGLANIGNGAHVGGVVFGMLAGAWFFGQAPRTLVRAAMSLFAVGSIVSLFWSPWSAPWVANRAYNAHVAGRHDLAISEYRHYMTMGGDRAWALANLAEVYAAQGSAREYEATLAELKALDPEAADEVRARIAAPAGR